MAGDRCIHDMVLCVQCVTVTDAAKRMSEAVNLAILFQPPDITRRGWMAFALADGSTDHVVYPSKEIAIAHMPDEYRYCYLCLNRCIAGMPLKDAQLWLDLHRHVYDNGGRLTDPKSDLILPVAKEHRITKPVIPGPWPWVNHQGRVN